MSYRDMEAEQLIVCAAIDLATSIPPIYPVSVDYILQETVLTCLKDDVEKGFSEFLNDFENLPDYNLNLPADETGRISISAFLKLLMEKKEKFENFQIRTGVSPSATLKSKDLAVILLHDIQAFQIGIK